MRRVPLQRTQFRAKGPQRRAAHPGQRRTLTGFPDTVKARVRSRSQNRCEVHTAGCLIGDVNQSNALVTPQALVRLIENALDHPPAA